VPVDLDAVDAQHRMRVGFVAPGDSHDAGFEFAKVEGLDEIVVGAGIQAFYAVGNLIAGGEDDDRRAEVAAADAAEEIDAAAIRQLKVEQDQAVFDRAGGGVGIREVLDPIDSVMVCGNVIAHGLTNHPVVFNQQNSHDLSLSDTVSVPLDIRSSSAIAGKDGAAMAEPREACRVK
jgi:hypothetical protein